MLKIYEIPIVSLINASLAYCGYEKSMKLKAGINHYDFVTDFNSEISFTTNSPETKAISM